MKYLLLEVEAHNEVETGIAAVYNFVSTVFDEWAESLITTETFSD